MNYLKFHKNKEFYEENQDGFWFPYFLEYPIVGRHVFSRQFNSIDFDQEYTVNLWREPTNPSDPNAIQVVINQFSAACYEETIPIGYIPKDAAFSLSTIIDENWEFFSIRVKYYY